jgi:creatinine amidohydrolase
MENFPWTRLDGVLLPDTRKKPIEITLKGELTPKALKNVLGDGN